MKWGPHHVWLKEDNEVMKLFGVSLDGGGKEKDAVAVGR